MAHDKGAGGRGGSPRLATKLEAPGGASGIAGRTAHRIITALSVHCACGLLTLGQACGRAKEAWCVVCVGVNRRNARSSSKRVRNSAIVRIPPLYPITARPSTPPRDPATRDSRGRSATRSRTIRAIRTFSTRMSVLTRYPCGTIGLIYNLDRTHRVLMYDPDFKLSAASGARVSRDAPTTDTRGTESRGRGTLTDALKMSNVPRAPQRPKWSARVVRVPSRGFALSPLALPKAQPNRRGATRPDVACTCLACIPRTARRCRRHERTRGRTGRDDL